MNENMQSQILQQQRQSKILQQQKALLDAILPIIPQSLLWNINTPEYERKEE